LVKSLPFSSISAWHGLRLALMNMRRSLDPESAPPRGRRIAIALLILLLIALPLYLWPLRGGGLGLPGAAALSGLPRDPRDATAVAHLPADVWDGLMDEGRMGPKGDAKSAPGNLTRIAHLEEAPGDGPHTGAAGGASPSWSRDTLPRSVTPRPGDGLVQPDGFSDSLPEPVQFLAGPPGGEGTDAGNGWGGGSTSGFQGNLGPFTGGGGPGGGGPLFFSEPGDPGAPAPTPEPTTILLIGSNVALLGAAAWRRARATKETQPSG
jgi:hypothetical protein